MRTLVVEECSAEATATYIRWDRLVKESLCPNPNTCRLNADCRSRTGITLERCASHPDNFEKIVSVWAELKA